MIITPLLTTLLLDKLIGTESVMTTPVAVPSPVLEKFRVKVMVWPIIATVGVTVLVMTRSGDDRAT